MSALGDVQYIGRYHQYIGDILSKLGDVQYIGGYHDARGEQVDKILSISIEIPDVLNII